MPAPRGPLTEVCQPPSPDRRSRTGALVCALALLGSCATTGRSAETQIEELRVQLRQQSELVALQQGRLEQLELRLAAVAQARSEVPKAQPPPAAAPTAPAPKAAPLANPATPTPSSPKALQTVKLLPQGGRSRLLDRRASPSISLRANPVDRAPRLPAHVALKEPDDAVLAELVSAPLKPESVRDQAGADRSFAEAVLLLNQGQFLSAQTAFLAFAARHPRHAAADNALYYAGLARAASGDCEGALHHYDRVSHEYPAGGAVLASKLEGGRCRLRAGKRDLGRAQLELLVKEHPASSEASQAQRLLSEDQN